MPRASNGGENLSARYSWALAVLVLSATACRCREVRAAERKPVQVARWSADRFEVLSVALTDGQATVLYQRGRGPVSGLLPVEAALDSERNLLAVQEVDGPIELVRLGQGTKFELPGTEDCTEPVFCGAVPG